MSILPEGTTAFSRGQAAVYTAFGLRLEADPSIDLSRLGLGRAPGGEGPRTRLSLDPEELERRWAPLSAAAKRMRAVRQGDGVVLTVDLAEPAGYLLRAEGVGRMLVALDGSQVLCDPLAGSSDWEFILPAQVLPLAATLCGHEVLHAAGLVLGGRAALFTGAPGAGKSSLAAALSRRGARLLSDDCVALERRDDGSLLAHPGAGVLYLRDPEHDRLSAEDRDALGSATPFAGKQRYDPDVTGAAAPFGALFLLERAEQGPAVEPIEDANPFDLLAATFNLSVRTPQRLTRQLDLVEALIASASVYRLRVLPDMDATQLAAVVERHLTAESR
jgi:hypothetical protein